MLFSVRPPAGATVRGGAFLCLSPVGISPADVVLSRDRESSDAELTVDSDTCILFLQALPNLDLSPSVPGMLRLPVLCNVFFPNLLSHLCVGEENAHSFFLQQLKLKLRVEEFAITSYPGKGLSQKGHFF